MSQGIVEDEGEEGSEQKKEGLRNRVENGGQELESSDIIPRSVTSLHPSYDHYDTTSSGPDLTRHVFGSQCRSARETSQRDNNARHVDHIQETESLSNVIFKPHDPESREEDEGGGDVHGSSTNQFIGELERSHFYEYYMTSSLLFRSRRHGNGRHGDGDGDGTVCG